MEAVVGQRDAAADGPAGVVDQDVDPAVLVDHVGHHALDVLAVGQVAGVHERRATGLLELPLQRLELVGAAGHQQDRAAGLGDLQGGRLADARGGAGDHDPLARHRPGQRSVLEQRRVQVA